MSGGILDKITGLLDQRFVLGLVIPVLGFCAGVGALVATARGWNITLSWWAHLGGSRQALLAVALAAGVIFAATALATQVIPLTRLLEGYWGSNLIGRQVSAPFLRRQQRRLRSLEKSTSSAAGLRLYNEFPSNGQLQPTRLGNVLKAAECYPADTAQWGLDAVFWWPRLYLLLPDATRQQVDGARAAMDQVVVIAWLAVLFGMVSAGFGLAGLALSVCLPCVVGSFLMARVSYVAAVGAGVSFGGLVRSCFDLYRQPLLAALGWDTPPRWADERDLWRDLQQQLYRGEASNARLLTRERTGGTAGPRSAAAEPGCGAQAPRNAADAQLYTGE